MAKNRLPSATDQQALDGLMRRVASLSSDLLAELKKLEPYLRLGQKESTLTAMADVEQIKKRFLHRHFELGGFIVETKVLDDCVYIAWENTNPNMSGEKPAYCVSGYRTDDLHTLHERFVYTYNQKGEVLDYDIKPGVTRYYLFKAYTPVGVNEVTFDARLPKEPDELEAARRRFQIRQLERAAMSPAEHKLEVKEQEIVRTRVMLRVLTSIEEERKARIAEIEGSGLAPEEKEVQINVVNQLYKDLALRVHS